MDFGVNQGIVEELFSRYRDNPRAVDETWRHYFDEMSAQDRAELIDGPEAAHHNGNGHTATLVGLPSPTSPAPMPINGNGQKNGLPRPALVEELIGTGPRPKAPLLDAQTWNEYQERVTALVQGYRMRGHRFARPRPARP